MTLHYLFRSSVRHLRQPLQIAALFSLVLLPLFAMVGDWVDGVFLGLISGLVLAALAGPVAVSAARRSFRVRIRSSASFKAGLFAGAWALFWLLPLNLLAFAKHGAMFSSSDNYAFAMSLVIAGFLLSFVPAES